MIFISCVSCKFYVDYLVFVFIEVNQCHLIADLKHEIDKKGISWVK